MYIVCKMAVLHTSILVSLFCTSFAAPQQPETNDNLPITDLVTEKPESALSSDQPAQPEALAQPGQGALPEQQTQPERVTGTADKTVEDLQQNKAEIANAVKKNDTQVALPEVGFTFRIYRYISEPIFNAVNAPKVNEVLRNIGTCVVNGAMELVSYYLPAPFMPLLASAAGLMLPFEPVVMLKERMPVTSYRRAFQTAMSTFLRTFDKYKIDDEFDPYMTRRFNRRLMNDNFKKNVAQEHAEH